MLPKIKNKKLINEKEFVQNAKKVEESIKEEIKYIQEKKIKNEYNLSTNSHFAA